MFGLTPFRTRKAERALARREADPFEMFRREFGSLFERAFPAWPMETWEWEPWGFEVEEGENEMVVRAELPGFEASEIELRLTGNRLTIRAEHRENGKETAHRTVERTMTLPTGLELEKVEARYHNGVLEVHFPRVPEAKPRTIEVKT